MSYSNGPLSSLVPSNPNQNVNQPGLWSQLSTFTTTGTTGPPFWSLCVPRKMALSVRGMATAIRQDGGEAVSVQWMVMALSNSSGVISQIYEPVIEVIDRSELFTFVFAADVSTGYLTMKLATADGSNVYNWTCSYQSQMSPLSS